MPVIVYTGKDLTRARRRSSGATPRRSSSRTSARPSGCSTRPRCSSTGWRTGCRRRSGGCCEQLHDGNAVFAGKKILIVDDDVRNVFALTSVLEGHGMEVVFAENGARGAREARGEPGRRPRPDGHHDAGDGRVRDDAADPRA